MPTDKRMRRRSFLKRSATIAAAPWIIPQAVFASSGKPGANDRITVAIIGMGVRGNQLIGNIPSDGQLAAICDCDLRRTSAALTKHKADWSVYQDYRKLLDRKDIDAVIVCPMDAHHVHASVLACQAGKDVYCEKPLSVYVSEGRSLVKAARKYKRVVQTGTQQRTMEMNRFACELVRDGGIGKVRGVECIAFQSPKTCPDIEAKPMPKEVDWDVWTGPTLPERPFNESQLLKGWGHWRDYAGWRMTFLGAHAFDMIQYALGTDETTPVEYWPLAEGADAPLAFRYANGVEVRLSLPDEEPHRRGPVNGAIFLGEKCKIEINRNKFVTNPRDFVKERPSAELAAAWEGPDWVAKGHVVNWFDCIRSRGTPNADVEIGHRVATMCHLCNITRQLGRRLKWDPVAERFIDDDEANTLLDRPRRKGWELPNLA